MGSKGLKEEEEVELELGLSLGGNYRNAHKEEKGTQEVKRKRQENEMNECNGEEGGEFRKISKVNEQGLYLYPLSGIVVPLKDGSLVPCWYGKEVVNPVMSYGFVPLMGGLEPGSGQNCCRKEEKKNGGSDGSSLRSSSASFDRNTWSCEGGGSNESRSHSICSLPEQCNGSKSSSGKSVSEHSTTSNLSNAALPNEATNHSDTLVSSNSSQSCLSSPKEGLLETEPNSTNKETLTPANRTLGSSMETKREMGKPPKPHIQKQNTPPSFPFMPCVSTKGDGPDGKTVNGVLHRYTKTEVSIICMCHGSTFSPAEFVQHAGGKDISHPLRHITVMPPSF